MITPGTDPSYWLWANHPTKPGKWHIVLGDTYGTGGSLCGYQPPPGIEWQRQEDISLADAITDGLPWLCHRCIRLYQQAA